MRKMVYRLNDGTVVNSWAEVGNRPYTVELITITPPDEVEARIKYNQEQEKRGLLGRLPIHQ